MNIISYLKSLLPSFKKDRVLEDSRIVKTELETVSIISYVEAEKVFTGWTFKSKQMQDYIKIFNRNFKPGAGFGAKDNIVTSIRKALEKLLETHGVVEDKLQTHLEDVIMTEGVTCLKANLLQMLEGISFISKYSYKFLNYIYIVETSTQNDQNEAEFIKSNLSPADIAYIESSFVYFTVLLSTLAKSKQEIEKIIEKIPDILINSTNADAISSTIGHDKLSPMSNHGLIQGPNPTIFNNPIYHIGLMVAEYQANRYKLSKETKKVLELRLLNLQLIQQKNPDAKLEKEIEYIQSRIQGLDFKIKKMEE